MALKGLGRGLNALLPGGNAKGLEDGNEGRVLMLSIDRITPNPDQPRKTITRESLEELSKSIKSDGVLQPLLVRRKKIPGHYEIIAGERRWRAARLAGITEVPVCVRDLTDSEVMIVALVENIQREDLNAVEEAMAIQEVKEKLELTQDELATKLGKSRSHIANSLRLLQLPPKAQESLQHGFISAGHARCLLGMCENLEALDVFLTHILADQLSVRECEVIATEWKATGKLPWAEKALMEEKKPKRQLRKKSEAVRSLENSLGSYFSCKARIHGTTERGRISLSYSNEEEFKRILASVHLSYTPEDLQQ